MIPSTLFVIRSAIRKAAWFDSSTTKNYQLSAGHPAYKNKLRPIDRKRKLSPPAVSEKRAHPLDSFRLHY